MPTSITLIDIDGNDLPIYDGHDYLVVGRHVRVRATWKANASVGGLLFFALDEGEYIRIAAKDVRYVEACTPHIESRVVDAWSCPA